MLVLLSFALVLVATVLLVLGLLNDDHSLTLIYLSIGSSVLAAVVLLVALRRNKPTADRRVEPAPLPEPAVEPVVAAVEAAPSVAVAVAADPEPSEWLAAEQDDWTEGDEVDFPIADYNSLTVGQILPLLPQLYADEIDVVEERERLTKARPQVLAKLADLRDASASVDSADALASYTETTGSSWDDDDQWFPIEDYESLSAAQIRPLLPELDAEELALVRTRELSLGRRRSLLDEIDRRLGVIAPAAAKPAAKATSKTPSKSTTAVKSATKSATKSVAAAKSATKRPAAKAAATKAAATKAPAKAPAKKPATAASKTSTAKASAKQAPAKKAPVKQAPAKKAPAAKAATPAKKAPVKKAAAPAKKTAAVKKAAAPAKKATKR